MPLPVRSIRLGNEASRELEKNLWNDRYVPGKMSTNGATTSVSVRYRGGHTRSYSKKSYEVVRANQAFHYNAEYDDPSMIRNALSFAFFPMLGVPAPRTKHVMLMVNDEPKGVYLEIEGVGRRFFTNRKIGASSLFYAINNRADFGLISSESDRPKRSLLAGYEHRFGSNGEKAKLSSFIRGVNTLRGARVEAFIRSRLDVDNYLRWLAGAVLTGNYDGFEQNYAIYRSGKTGKLRMIPWDYEGTWGRNCYGRIVESDLVNVEGYNALTSKLMKFPSVRRQYRSILEYALNGPFTEKRLLPVAERMMGKIAPYMKDDGSRKWLYRDFIGEPNVIRNYIRERREIVKEEIYGVLGNV
ncbi:CotH kinase family protein [Cohnella phaseoli]|uniref:Spore coat protein H n=1 Tax=Cohnella phaseoli TaxID=456490 RepID=A0A3D9KM82_9BACL|nr:CotH kinase family protein [Cohnella phaseoli]RED87682.1 spore coat protein H [Cohnella phaseoli]